MKVYISLFFSILLFTSCLKDDENSFVQETEEDILKYIADNNLTASKTDSGLYYVINSQGTGDPVSSTSVVNINYKGYLLNGSTFGETSDAGTTFAMNSNLILGLREGLQLFNEGGEGKLLIPSSLGYAQFGNASGTIPGGAVLIFDVKLNAAYPSFEAENEAAILKYIEDNNLTATKTASGLYYVVNNEGTGSQPTATSNVTVDYKGYFLNGTVFDESTSSASFNLSRVIPGWTEGLQFFKKGGDGVLLIPYTLGYGTSGTGTIPGYSVLVFDVKLISVN
ncbi:FKBP-type peptidyl-prolyl cis-trans isomerase [uncultured Polaribacter sp.]|uniref:FKBP-type peptidyl-prolyl cis-trans isomerase n=1 Tax=uncultured Polaribacter sp. TaxID=174711 RepID=UPI00345417FC